MKYIFLFSLLLVAFNGQSQEKLPYYEIPEAPESFTAGTVAARAIDGLGFRYYWATEGLREEDLAFKPNTDARTTLETVEHIYGLSKMIVNSTLKKDNNIKDDEEELTPIHLAEPQTEVEPEQQTSQTEVIPEVGEVEAVAI